MTHPDSQRLHALDAVRGFALLLGVAFHAALSFMPGWPPGLWAMNDNSPSAFLSDAAFVSHVFRMSLFFFIAGYFGRLLHQKLGTGAFWGNRLKRIAVPLVVGWVILFPLIAYIWMTGITKTLGFTPPMPEMPKTPLAIPLTHLWFLYQLLVLYVGALAIRAVVVRLDAGQKLRDVISRVVVTSLRAPLAVSVLGIPLAITLFAIPVWFYWTGIPTPEHSLIPQLPATVGYGTAFAFGWLVNRAGGAALEAMQKTWFIHLAVGVGAIAWMMNTMHAQPMAMPGFTKHAYAYAFGVGAWGITLGLTGAALRFLSGYSATRRYIADASYWVYLAHLPLVAALQVWVGHWTMPWYVKFPFIVITSFVILFASYHLLVRSTVIGQWLNGRKYPWKSAAPAPDPQTPSPTPSGPGPTRNDGTAPVAELRGVTKKFGSITALSGIDIEVRAGELLAVLGPNGAGKSTAISLWLGLHEADTGDVRLLGGSPQDVAQRLGLGVMMQDVELPKELRVRELVRLASSYYADPLPLEETLRRAGVAAFADRAYGKLSGGQKRLTQFAIAICGQPRVLFLDEPSVGLDIQAREALWNSIRGLLSAGCSIVLTTHYLEEAEALAHRVTVVTQGRVVASGSVDDMRALVERKQISCESRITLDEVRTWPGIVEARIDRDRLHITTTDAEGAVRRLLAADSSLRRLEVRQAGLNEAFNEITNPVNKEAA